MKKCPHANRGNRCVDYYEHPLRVKPLREAPAILIMEQRMCRKRGSCKSTKSTTRRSRPQGIQRLTVDGWAHHRSGGFLTPVVSGTRMSPLRYASQIPISSLCRCVDFVDKFLTACRDGGAPPTEGGFSYPPRSRVGKPALRYASQLTTHNSRLATLFCLLPPAK